MAGVKDGHNRGRVLLGAGSAAGLGVIGLVLLFWFLTGQEPSLPNWNSGNFLMWLCLFGPPVVLIGAVVGATWKKPGF